MDVGFVQFAPVLADLKTTIERIEQLSAQYTGADLLVLPELCNSGYNFVSREQAWATSEEIGDGVFLQYLTSLCRRLDCHIVSGLNGEHPPRAQGGDELRVLDPAFQPDHEPLAPHLGDNVAVLVGEAREPLL